jgi:hypothetical protein
VDTSSDSPWTKGLVPGRPAATANTTDCLRAASRQTDRRRVGQ